LDESSYGGCCRLASILEEPQACVCLCPLRQGEHFNATLPWWYNNPPATEWRYLRGYAWQLLAHIPAVLSVPAFYVSQRQRVRGRLACA
jgi:hypothetical protein